MDRIANWAKKTEEKTLKYRPLRWELKQHFKDMKCGDITSLWMSEGEVLES